MPVMGRVLKAQLSKKAGNLFTLLAFGVLENHAPVTLEAFGVCFGLDACGHRLKTKGHQNHRHSLLQFVQHFVFHVPTLYTPSIRLQCKNATPVSFQCG